MRSKTWKLGDDTEDGFSKMRCPAPNLVLFFQMSQGCRLEREGCEDPAVTLFPMLTVPPPVISLTCET